MIRVRQHANAPIEEIDLGEFEERAKNGDIAPHHQVCFPAVTGERFVQARELELFRGLYAAGSITFKRYFNLGRVPWLTLGLIATLTGIYYLWQDGRPNLTEDLLRQGAKSRTLVLELGQWWRLVTANLLHVSSWHLFLNALFLLNLGGPTEAVFRRLDYLLVVAASALGTTLLSTLANPAVSCGASGIVFGVWGAAAVFGMRHRDILPDRYRRYFIGSVIPYSIFALYIGFAMEGVDNWGHLGGLLSGSAVALFIPARLLHPKDPAAAAKLLALSATFLALAILTFMPAGPGELSSHRYFPQSGLVVPVPQRWSMSLSRREERRETVAFENSAGVILAFEGRREDQPVSLDDLHREFVERDLAQHLEVTPVRGVRIMDPEDATVAGLPAKRLRTEVVTENATSRADFLLVARGYFRYVVSLSTPIWLRPQYEPHFQNILSQVELTDSDELNRARQEAESRPGALAPRIQMAKALAHLGSLEEALGILIQLHETHPNNGSSQRAEAELLYESGREPERACARITEALETLSWTPELVLTGIDVHNSCRNHHGARKLAEIGAVRFPGHEGIRQRLAAGQETTP